MIVVVGSAAYLPAAGAPGRAVGLAAEIAAAAASAGAQAEIVSRIGDDGAGEELLLALGRAAVGHLAVLRDPARPTALASDTTPAETEVAEPAFGALLGAGEDAPGDDGTLAIPPGPALDTADIALGLSYLRDQRVVVAVEPLPEGAAAVIADAAAFAGAALVVAAAPGVEPAPAYATATVLETPAEDPDGAFATLVGRFAAALDRGVETADAFRSATGEGGWEPAGG